MIDTVHKLYALLDAHGRRRTYLMLVLIVAMAFVEMVGVASIMPFVAVLSNPEVVETNPYMNVAYVTLGFEDPQAFMFFLGVAMLGALLFAIAFKAVVTYAMLRFAQMRNYALSCHLVESYLHQPYDYFLNRHSADLGKSVLSEANHVIGGALKPMMEFIAGVTVTIALVLLLLAVEPKLTLGVALGLGLGYGGVYLLVRGYLHRLGKRRVEANRERFEAVQECFGGIKDVKVTGLEAPFLKRFDTPAKTFARVQARAAAVKTLPKFALQGMIYCGAFVVVLYLLRQPGGLEAAAPTLALFALAIQRLLPSLKKLYQSLSALRFSGAALDSLHDDLNRLNREAEGFGKRVPTPMGVTEAIRLDQVDYTYPMAERPALNGLDLTIPAHTTVGLVGATGSGKTTTVDILLGLLRPHGGQLTVDGKAITPANVRAWQRTIGYVPQHIYLADDTVAGNIAFGLPPDQVDIAAVERAARVANLHAFVTEEMPDGYATPVGERGVRLSGGQRQRIGIARALYHDPQVLVLDEATSALDNLTEQAVMEAVHNLSHSKTIILIAHRLTTVQPCDEIFVLEKGRLVGRGRYHDLVETNSRFQAMAANH